MIHNTILLTLNEPVKRMVVSYKEASYHSAQKKYDFIHLNLQ